MRRSGWGAGRGGPSYERPSSRRAEQSASAAASANTAAGLPTASRRAAASGPRSVLSESISPRTKFALVSSSGVKHRIGSKAEWAGRNTVKAAVATARTMHDQSRTRSRRRRSASAVPSGTIRAAGAVRTNATRPTAVAPPCSKATTPRATVNAHSPAKLAPNDSCARRRFGLRPVTEKARVEAPRQLRGETDTSDSITGRSAGQGLLGRLARRVRLLRLQHLACLLQRAPVD